MLASEGAEVQGYLKKQAKNKALGKHMQHGGVNSFSFHPSPRMVLFPSRRLNTAFGFGARVNAKSLPIAVIPCSMDS